MYPLRWYDEFGCCSVAYAGENSWIIQGDSMGNEHKLTVDRGDCGAFKPQFNRSFPLITEI